MPRNNFFGRCALGLLSIEQIAAATGFNLASVKHWASKKRRVSPRVWPLIEAWEMLEEHGLKLPFQRT